MNPSRFGSRFGGPGFDTSSGIAVRCTTCEQTIALPRAMFGSVETFKMFADQQGYTLVLNPVTLFQGLRCRACSGEKVSATLVSAAEGEYK